MLAAAGCALGALLGATGDSAATTVARPVDTTRLVETKQRNAARMAGALLAAPAAVSRVYQLREYRPIWAGERGQILANILEHAEDDGLDPKRYGVERLRALASDPARAADADIAYSLAWIVYLQDLRSPPATARMTYVDAVLAPERRAADILMAAANAQSLRDHLLAARRMHPLYEQLRAALARHRSEPAVHSGRSGPEYERRLLANMARLRALPANPGQRYLLVDVASARLWMYEEGRPIDAMRVVVGKTSQPTPTIAGLIRYAIRKPYWNLPPDLTRARAVKVLREGPRVLDRERLEMLSDWTPSARLLDAGEIDWRSVAAGTQKLRMRQLPGPGNMMGEVKFMLPNTLGIYLHDTPDKAVFGRSRRTLSSGCVRLEDAARLGRWLAGGGEVPASKILDERIDLPAPVPVYIVYLTVMPAASGIVMQDDPYRRDEPAGLLRS